MFRNSCNAYKQPLCFRLIMSADATHHGRNHNRDDFDRRVDHAVVRDVPAHHQHATPSHHSAWGRSRALHLQDQRIKEHATYRHCQHHYATLAAVVTSKYARLHTAHIYAMFHIPTSWTPSSTITVASPPTTAATPVSVVAGQQQDETDANTEAGKTC